MSRQKCVQFLSPYFYCALVVVMVCGANNKIKFLSILNTMLQRLIFFGSFPTRTIAEIEKTLCHSRVRGREVGFHVSFLKNGIQGIIAAKSDSCSGRRPTAIIPVSSLA